MYLNWADDVWWYFSLCLLSFFMWDFVFCCGCFNWWKFRPFEIISSLQHFSLQTAYCTVHLLSQSRVFFFAILDKLFVKFVVETTDWGRNFLLYHGYVRLKIVIMEHDLMHKDILCSAFDGHEPHVRICNSVSLQTLIYLAIIRYVK